MSRFYLTLPEINLEQNQQRSYQQRLYQQIFQQQEYICGDLSIQLDARLVNDCWKQFSATWNNLVPDQHMGDGGHYRQRRYSVFGFDTASGHFEINADQRHYQSLNYNPLNGGIYREYSPFEEGFLENTLFQALLSYAMRLVSAVSTKSKAWHIEAHQFRILATADESGKPTPEGLHKDGRDYVFIVLVNRRSIKGGASRFYKETGNRLMQKTLRNPLEFMLVNDRKLLHYVTKIQPMQQDEQGLRDVLVLTFRKSGLDFP